MCAFVAAIRRVPGGGAFAKMPKSQAMPAVPVQTSFSNLTTYFDQWPKRKSEFILYGPRRPFGTAVLEPLSNGDPKVQKGAVDKSVDCGDHLNLYGPKLSAPDAAGPPAGGCSGGGASGKPAMGTATARPLGLAGLLQRFQQGSKLTMITAYDFPSARLARSAGVEVVLVGDSLGNCRLGLNDTVGVTMDDMLRATLAARRGIDAAPHEVCQTDPGPKPVLVGDMPFGSYLMEADTLKNAAAFRVAGADMVKLEGGRQCAALVRALTAAGIAVMGHIGLEPQKALLQGGLKMQGTTASSAFEILQDAKELAAAGAVALVVECVPVELGCAIQAAVPGVPVIGIGAGGQVAGQVLVCDDLLGVHGRPPSFVKVYADVAKASAAAYGAYVSEVRSGSFPAASHSRRMKPDELAKLSELLAGFGMVDPAVALSTLAATTLATTGTRGATPTPATGVGQDAAPSSATPGLRDATTSVDPDGADAGPHCGQSPQAVASESHKKFPGSTVAALEVSARSQKASVAQMPKVNGVHVPKMNGAQLAGARAIFQASARRGSSSSFLSGASGSMQVLRTRKEVHAWRCSAQRVALVPTMGNLHEGHLELIDEAKKHADRVLVSIFVNPSQFAPHEDLDRYPRTLERDLELLQARGAAAVFAPTPAEIYPCGSPGGTVVVPRFVEGKSEAACRPHFFTGVATVCLKLFNICAPDVVVFGQKDAMQCAVIASMLEELMLDHRIALVVAPTSRDADGLARSSRNSYLTDAMRRKAPAIYAALASATGAAGATPGSVRLAVQEGLQREGISVSYVSVADAGQMEEKGDCAPLAGSVVSVACLLKDGDHECRLIDNVTVPAAGAA